MPVDVTAPQLRNQLRRENEQSAVSHNHVKANPIQSSHGKADISAHTPIDDGCGNSGVLDDRFVNTATATAPPGEANPKAFADRATYWMVGDKGNQAAKVEWAYVVRSDGQGRYYPTVAF